MSYALAERTSEYHTPENFLESRARERPAPGKNGNSRTETRYGGHRPPAPDNSLTGAVPPPQPYREMRGPVLAPEGPMSASGREFDGAFAIEESAMRRASEQYGKGHDAPKEKAEERESWLSKAIDAGQELGGLYLGIPVGAFESIKDLFVGSLDVAKLALELYRELDDLGFVATCEKIWSNLCKLWDDKEEIFQGLVQSFKDGWNDPDDFERGMFRGKVIGYICMEIVVGFISAGAITAAKAAGKLGTSARVLLKLLRTADAMQDVTTYVRPIGKAAKTGSKLLEHLSDARVGPAKKRMPDATRIEAPPKKPRNELEDLQEAGYGSSADSERTVTLSRWPDGSEKTRTRQTKRINKKGEEVDIALRTYRPRNIREQAAARAVIGDPRAGRHIQGLTVNDKKRGWYEADGWQKWTRTVDGGGPEGPLTLHYNYNVKTGQVDDVKIVLEGKKGKAAHRPPPLEPSVGDGGMEVPLAETVAE